jgi:hypothetical protein
MLQKITIEIIPHAAQRYDTLGDWLYDRITGTHDDALTIKISDTCEFRSTMCLAVHELIEALLCRLEGVTQTMVDRWDMGPGKDMEEPGADPHAPYHRQHYRAEVVERIVCEMMGMRWHWYEERLMAAMEASRENNRGSVGSPDAPAVDK